MFTGIIEVTGTLVASRHEGSNVHLTVECPFTDELHIDQSLAHDGVCLTVVAIEGPQYTVTAIDETMQKTNLGEREVGDAFNLERCTKVGARLDGHIVQGHVDTTARLERIDAYDGSWGLHFRLDNPAAGMTVEKGSITINGVSLTVVDSGVDTFSVAIIPYTWEHTNLHALKPGISRVNIEFDIVGKYVAKLLQR